MNDEDWKSFTDIMNNFRFITQTLEKDFVESEEYKQCLMGYFNTIYKELNALRTRLEVKR